MKLDLINLGNFIKNRTVTFLLRVYKKGDRPVFRVHSHINLSKNPVFKAIFALRSCK